MTAKHIPNMQTQRKLQHRIITEIKTKQKLRLTIQRHPNNINKINLNRQIQLVHDLLVEHENETWNR